MDEYKQLEQSLLSTLRQSDLRSIGANLSEIGIDQLMQDGLLKDIPVVNILTGLLKTSRSIRDHIFLKKLLSFLVSIKDIEPEEREKAIERLESDSAYSQKVGEGLMLLLERLDDLNKPKMVAKAFKAYCRGNINSFQLQRLYYAIDRVLACDLPFLKYYSNMHPGKLVDPNRVVEQNFLNSGFLYVQAGYGGTTSVEPTEICDLFIKFALDN